MDTSIDEQVAAVVKELAATVDLPMTTIETEVRQAFGDWKGATIRTFVPIFVERAVRDRLAARSS